MFLHYGKSLGLGKRPDARNVGGVRPMVAREVLLAQVSDTFAGGEARDPRLHRLQTAAAHEHAHLETFRRIGGPHHTGAGNGRPLTALQENSRHLSPPR